VYNSSGCDSQESATAYVWNFVEILTREYPSKPFVFFEKERRVMSTLLMRTSQLVSWMLAMLLILLILQDSYAFHVLSPTRRSASHTRTKRRKSPLPALSSETPEDPETKKNPSLMRLAELSLKDYDWRSSVFKSKEADRKVEESLARMMGDEPIYVRPMDASEGKIGPLVSTPMIP